MSDIRFYHLTRRTAEQALPELVDRAFSKGHKIVVRCGEEAEAVRLNDALWTFPPDSFLPHGTAKDGNSGRQPIYITHRIDNPAGADVLMLMPGASEEGIDDYKLCCMILNGHDEARISAARGLWKTWKAAGHSITYWQQSEQGKWEQKA
jgi:DNA polymerase-3 subunit chi